MLAETRRDPIMSARMVPLKLALIWPAELAVGDRERAARVGEQLAADGPTADGAIQQVVVQLRHVPDQVRGQLVAIVERRCCCSRNSDCADRRHAVSDRPWLQV